MVETQRLSKSRVMAGLQCPKALWWRVHEPMAPELEVSPTQQYRMDSGTRVGELARGLFPGGVFLGGDLAATQKALASGARVLFEPSFIAEGVFVAVDVLLRTERGWTLVEVKSSTGVKSAHLRDAAVQVWVLRQAGISVDRVEVMHLNSLCRSPDLSNLFLRVELTAQVEQELPTLHKAVLAQHALLAGPLPDVLPGAHCTTPRGCPFLGRCVPHREHDIGTLYRSENQVDVLRARGVTTVFEVEDDLPLSEVAARQVRAVKGHALVVEPGLAEALAQFHSPLGFLDFETIAPAVPFLHGCGPYHAVPVQFSFHAQVPGGGFRHSEWLALPGGDCREALAEALVQAAEGTNTVLAYNANFEKGVLRSLAEHVPRLAKPLMQLEARVEDLLPVVRKFVYHPDFRGSFSLKSVAPALCPEIDYASMAVGDGASAAAVLEHWILGLIPKGEMGALRKNLLAYCEQDTWATVRLWQRFQELSPPAQ